MLCWVWWLSLVSFFVLVLLLESSFSTSTSFIIVVATICSLMVMSFQNVENSPISQRFFHHYMKLIVSLFMTIEYLLTQFDVLGCGHILWIHVKNFAAWFYFFSIKVYWIRKLIEQLPCNPLNLFIQTRLQEVILELHRNDSAMLLDLRLLYLLNTDLRRVACIDCMDRLVPMLPRINIYLLGDQKANC